MAGELVARLRRIGWQLPISIAALVLAVVGTSSWVAYREVRRAALQAAGERLQDVSRQLSGLLAQSAQLRLGETQRVANDPVVVTALAVPEAGTRARQAFRRLFESSEQVAAVELWGTGGDRVLETHRSGPGDTLTVRTEFPAWLAGDTAAVSGFRSAGEILWYEVAAAVRRAGRTVGYVVQARQLSSSPQAAQLIADLIGMDARFLVGESGGTWTDLSHVVDGPPVTAWGSADVGEYRGAGGTWRLGAGRPIAGTPWAVWVEFPRAEVLARSRAFLHRVVVMGMGMVILGAAGGWALSRRVTTPLEELTGAARAVAAGNYARRVPAKRRDELGELAQAFNLMAERVEDAQHRLEHRVRERTAELEAANQELESFSYSVSHDLRAPLRSIHGFSQALLEEYGGQLNAQGADYLRRVCAATERMAQLIDDLLELSRVTRAELRREPVDLSALAQRIAAELRSRAPEREAEFHIAQGLMAEGDPWLLRVALDNLLGNAWKFSANEPRVRIEVGATGLDTDRTYFVRDNGVGFDMAYADKLFGAFQRLHTVGEFPGTGIGLATVQRVIHRHGGRVWGEGTPGRGATFYFTLSASAT